MNILRLIDKLFKKSDPVNANVAEEDLVIFTQPCLVHIAIAHSPVGEGTTEVYPRCAQCEYKEHCLVVKDYDKLLDK